MIAAVKFARAMAKQLVGDVQGLTVDEIDLDDSAQAWVIALSFWLPSPFHKSGVAIISPAPLHREVRTLRIGAQSPARLLSMKARPLIGS